jgi:hypothetical protein
MANDKVLGKLRNKDDAVTRTIKVKPEEGGPLFLMEVIDTSLTHPHCSWTLFPSLADAEAGARAEYQTSLKEGFCPLA